MSEGSDDTESNLETANGLDRRSILLTGALLFALAAVDFPPMQPAASFNLEAVKAQITKAMQARQ